MPSPTSKTANERVMLFLAVALPFKFSIFGYVVGRIVSGSNEPFPAASINYSLLGFVIACAIVHMIYWYVGKATQVAKRRSERRKLRSSRREKHPKNDSTFDDRISQYTELISRSNHGATPVETTRSQMPYWSASDSWQGSPPKSAGLIRRLVNQIRYWVRLGKS